MAIKLISAGGNVVDAAVINMYASGVVQRNSLVDLPRSFATGGANGFTLLAPSSASSTRTMVFVDDALEGARRVNPFAPPVKKDLGKSTKLFLWTTPEAYMFITAASTTLPPADISFIAIDYFNPCSICSISSFVKPPCSNSRRCLGVNFVPS